MELELVAAAVAGLAAINVASRLRRRARVNARKKQRGTGRGLRPSASKAILRADRLRSRHGYGQPVKKFKDKMRIIGKPKHVFTGTRVEGEKVVALWKGVDKKNWVRLYPNPGYRIRGRHWCLRTHTTPIAWPAEEA